MIAWDKICQPKNYGGLGLRKTGAVNSTFLAKLGWKILSDRSNLRVQSIHAKYLKNSSFFECHPQSKDSRIWRKILQIRPLLLKGLRWKVGSGSDILFWLDNWCSPVNLVSSLNLDTLSVSNLEITLDNFITSTQQWDIVKLKSVLPPDWVTKLWVFRFRLVRSQMNLAWVCLWMGSSRLNRPLGWLIALACLKLNGNFIGFGN